MLYRYEVSKCHQQKVFVKVFGPRKEEGLEKQGGGILSVGHYPTIQISKLDVYQFIEVDLML